MKETDLKKWKEAEIQTIKETDTKKQERQK